MNMYVTVRLVCNCDWDFKDFETGYSVRSIEELGNLSRPLLRKALHHIYKSWEYPIEMTREMSAHLDVQVYPRYAGVEFEPRLTEIEEGLKTYWFDERRNQVNKWRVA